MTLQLSEEQRSLVSSVRRLLESRCTDEYLRRRIAENTPSDPELWKDLTQLGLFEYFGDRSLSGFRDLALLAHEFGRALVPESMIDAIFAGAFAPSRLIDKRDLKQFERESGRSLATLLDGSTRVAFAPVLPQSDAVGYRGKGPDYRITTELRFVSGASASEVCLATLPNANGERTLFLCDLVTGKEQRTICAPELSGDKSEKRERVTLQNVLGLSLSNSDWAPISLCYKVLKSAEIAGAVKRCVELTVEYVKTRSQFGVPIGGFQAVQQRLAQMHAVSEAMSALSDFAAWSADHSPTQLSTAALSSIRYATEEGPPVIEGAIQLHGGIGFTYEYPVHLYLRRVKLLEAIFGPTPESDAALLRSIDIG